MASVTGYDQAGYPTLRNAPQSRRESSTSPLSSFRLRSDVEYARSLNVLIESEIIPRLMVAHAFDARPLTAGGGSPEIATEEIEAFAPLALQVEADALLDHVERLLHRGVSVDTLLVDLLAPAARLLGEFWEDDRCDFVEVTMGL